jgi:hypothetical protein
MVKKVIKWTLYGFALLCCGIIGWLIFDFQEIRGYVIFGAFIGYIIFMGVFSVLSD